MVKLTSVVRWLVTVGAPRTHEGENNWLVFVFDFYNFDEK